MRANINIVPVILTLMIVLGLGSPEALAVTPSSGVQADAKIAAGDYRGAHRFLEKEARQRDLAPGERVEVLVRLAIFYEDQVGDDRRAQKIWQRLRAASPTPEAAAEAGRAIDRITRRGERLAGLDGQLNTMRMRALQPVRRDAPDFRQAMQTQRDVLEAMLQSDTDRFAHIAYTLGLTHLALEQPFYADRAFSRAIAKRPAFGLLQPIERLQRTARQTWARHLVQGAAWTVMIFFWASLAIGVAVFRPWAWVRWRHLIALPILVLVWSLVYGAVLYAPGRHGRVADFVNADGFYPLPTYVHTLPGDPESEIAGLLYGYGLVALCGPFLLCVVTARMRRRQLRKLLCGLAGIGFGLAVAFHFYFMHCAYQSRLYRRDDSPVAWVGAQFAFRSTEPEPYLLTNPLAYAGVELASISDPLLVDWLAAHVPAARRVETPRRSD